MVVEVAVGTEKAPRGTCVAKGRSPGPSPVPSPSSAPSRGSSCSSSGGLCLLGFGGLLLPACKILVLQQGIKSVLLAMEAGVLTTGPPAKSHDGGFNSGVVGLQREFRILRRLSLSGVLPGRDIKRTRFAQRTNETQADTWSSWRMCLSAIAG